MKIVGFISTPRNDGNSGILAEQILAGAAEAGAETTQFRLAEYHIKHCTACDACQASVDTPCVLKDDMPPLIEAIREADALVFAAPIYFASVDGRMKTFLDRLHALFGGGVFDELQGRNVAFAFAYGDPDPVTSGMINALRMFQDASNALGMESVGWVGAECDSPGSVRDNQDAMTAARRLGEKLGA